MISAAFYKNMGLNVIECDIYLATSELNVNTKLHPSVHDISHERDMINFDIAGET